MRNSWICVYGVWRQISYTEKNVFKECILLTKCRVNVAWKALSSEMKPNIAASGRDWTWWATRHCIPLSSRRRSCHSWAKATGSRRNGVIEIPLTGRSKSKSAWCCCWYSVVKASSSWSVFSGSLALIVGRSRSTSTSPRKGISRWVWCGGDSGPWIISPPRPAPTRGPGRADRAARSSLGPQCSSGEWELSLRSRN